MLMNPVVISVLVMCGLCLLKVNVLLAILISTVIAGVTSGIPLLPVEGSDDIMSLLVMGMGGQTETALSYVLLGALAAGIYSCGLATMLSKKIEKVFSKKAYIFLIALAIISSFSQNLIPIHIAFVPILIPPLISMMNDMNIDRRAAACAITFGLKAPYLTIPAGFGIIFHGILATNLEANGLAVETGTIWRYMIIPGLSMVFGLLIAIFITYRKPREYENKPVIHSTEDDMISDKLTTRHLGAILGSVSAFAVQIFVGSLPLGATIGIIVMLLFKTIPFNKLDDTMSEGIKMMGFIAFVMMVASGYGAVIRASGGVETIVEASVDVVGGSQLLGAILMMLIGLLVTMGIGTSFGTIPIIATIFVPFSLALGFSPASTIILVAVAGVTGDAGAPASDSTLAPTAGLNVDGQHDHIWDTCVPTFLHFNIPLIIFGIAAAMIF